jgi:molybdate transport repressor ModE-like protein
MNNDHSKDSLFNKMNKTKLLPSMLMFAEVAKQGSFTQAAKQLKMSKSAVSQQISRLEESLGQQLLSRNTRGLALTNLGEKLLQRCELLQDQVDLALVELSNNEHQVSGRFSVTFPHSIEQDIALPAICQLCKEYPLLEPEIRVTDEKLDLVKDKLDVAIYAGELKDSNYRALPIGAMTEIWCASSNYLQRSGGLGHLEQLADHRWIATHWQKPQQTLFDLQGNETAIKLKPFCQVNTLPSAIAMGKRDMGLVLLPDISASPALLKQELVRVLPDFKGKSWPFYFMHGFQAEKPQHVSRFYQLISHFFAKAQIN